MKTLEDIGELELVELITSKLENSEIVAGVEMLPLIKSVGDDAAVLKIGDNKSLLISKDLLIEDIHFLKENIIPEQFAHKALAVNISDIAAMGGHPGWVVIGLAAPSKTPVSFITALYDAFIDVSARYGLKIIGGDTCSSPGPIILSITILGLINSDKAIYRDGAREGDRIMVSGTLGGSRIGLSLLTMTEGKDRHKAENNAISQAQGRLIRRHCVPTPRVDIGKLLAENELATSMIDISDGLIQDLRHICKSSHVGALIKKGALPVDPDIFKVGDIIREDPYDSALAGGEDYELLFTVTEDKRILAQSLLFEKTGVTINEIGYIVSSTLNEITIEDEKGKRNKATYKGFEHFKSFA